MVRHFGRNVDVSSEDGFSSSSLIESNDEEEMMETTDMNLMPNAIISESGSTASIIRPAVLRRKAQKPRKKARKSVKNVHPKNIVAVEIQKLQQTTHLLIPHAPFLRLLKQVLLKLSPRVDHLQRLAVVALHEALEAFLVHLMEDSYLLTLHAGRVTLMLPDMRLALALRNRSHYGTGNL
ncbi:histone H3-like centromeric protein A [Trichinella pseudospiralis]|uniref:Histone H3-like centromeric protein A n=1 Tax=Trichinella pseudospiralis TaxID=6337 RepID=A0A0V1IIW8_TRIPS|nr:histone H3-like centromeric protein A [Trichinella pseudospiralis]KRY78310.1 histone H3-like centromeric protein A [Trichinella pseudospiralis]KRZ22133.1 histone H3-like centromeric protein A [Trichinella pseudospiralis]KRZ45064.1 histone H3-like centromeric protein A [Trichinella pseudospiralis]